MPQLTETVIFHGNNHTGSVPSGSASVASAGAGSTAAGDAKNVAQPHAKFVAELVVQWKEGMAPFKKPAPDYYKDRIVEADSISKKLQTALENGWTTQTEVTNSSGFLNCGMIGFKHLFETKIGYEALKAGRVKLADVECVKNPVCKALFEEDTHTLQEIAEIDAAACGPLFDKLQPGARARAGADQKQIAHAAVAAAAAPSPLPVAPVPASPDAVKLQQLIKPSVPTNFSNELAQFLDMDFYLTLTARQRLDVLKYFIVKSEIKNTFYKYKEESKLFLKLSFENNVAYCEELKLVCRSGGLTEKLLTECISELRQVNASAVPTAANAAPAPAPAASFSAAAADVKQSTVAGAVATVSAGADAKSVPPQAKSAGHLAFENMISFASVDVGFYNTLIGFVGDDFFAKTKLQRRAKLAELKTRDIVCFEKFMDFLMTSVQYQYPFFLQIIDQNKDGVDRDQLRELEKLDKRFYIIKYLNNISNVNEMSAPILSNPGYADFDHTKKNRTLMQYALILAYVKDYPKNKLREMLGPDFPEDLYQGLFKIMPAYFYDRTKEVRTVWLISNDAIKNFLKNYSEGSQTNRINATFFIKAFVDNDDAIIRSIMESGGRLASILTDTRPAVAPGHDGAREAAHAFRGGFGGGVALPREARGAGRVAAVMAVGLLAVLAGHRGGRGIRRGHARGGDLLVGHEGVQRVEGEGQFKRVPPNP